MATTPNPFEDFSKMLEQFKIPGMDMEAVLLARRKDIDALTQANRLAYEGMQALMKKQTEIFSQTMQEIQDSMRQFNTGGNPAQAMTQQGELVQQALQKAFANMRELAEMAQKSQVEAMTVIGDRARQSLQETGEIFKPK